MERLFTAIASGRIDSVERALAECSPGAVLPGVDLLRAAIDSGELEIVRLLVERGLCNPTIRGEDERSGIEHAAGFGRRDLVAYLARFVSPTLRRRAERAIREGERHGFQAGELSDDFVAIYQALGSADASAIERLVMLREPGTRFDSGSAQPLLIWAIEALCPAKVVELLLRLGAPAEVTEHPFGRTPLMMAAHMGRADLVSLLLRAGADPNRGDARGWNPLMFLAGSPYLAGEISQGVVEVLDALFAAGTSLAARSQLGHTAAMIAMLKGYAALADLLVTRGVPEQGLSEARLCLACQAGDVEAIEHALAARPRLEAKDDDGTPVIVLAARSGSDAAVQTLLDAGFAASARSTTGETALHAACTSGSLVMIQKLIKVGADAFDEDENGETPLFHARGAGGAAVDVLQEYCRRATAAGPSSPRALVALRCLVMHGTEEASADAIGLAISWLREMSPNQVNEPAAARLLTELLDRGIEARSGSPDLVVLALGGPEGVNLDAALTAIEQMPALARDPRVRAALRVASERHRDEITSARLAKLSGPPAK